MEGRRDLYFPASSYFYSTTFISLPTSDKFLDLFAPSVMFPNSLVNKMSLMKINQIFMYN